jgi:hypothetical protein
MGNMTPEGLASMQSMMKGGGMPAMPGAAPATEGQPPPAFNPAAMMGNPDMMEMMLN